MQMDVSTILVANILFSLRVTPIVIVGATLLRGAVLLTGRKREFEEWTRNPLLTILTIIFFPGMLIHLGIRYIVSKAFGVGVDKLGGSTTYGELNLFLRVDKPPRVSAVLLTVFVSTFLSVFVAFLCIALPVVMIFSAPMTLLLWYISVSVLFNSSLKMGDASLIGASLRRRPRTGMLEMVAVMAALVIIYLQVWGMPL
ncbi:MAG: hypothetical protein RTU30_06675 [Candidatus Thorarchaeota archaeon]